VKELWEPFVEVGKPEEGWDELTEAITALRAIASEALLAIFKLRMSSEVEAAADRLFARNAKKSR
jgi:hypothetical protein